MLDYLFSLIISIIILKYAKLLEIMLNYAKIRYITLRETISSLRNMKNDDETSNAHKTALGCPISVNDQFLRNLRKDACIGDGFAIF